MAEKIAVVAGDCLIAEKLENLGYITVKTVKPAGLPGETAFHPDMTVCRIDDGTAVVHTSQTEIISVLENNGIKVIEADCEFGAYPEDIAFNAAFLNGRCIGKKSAVHEEIRKLAGENFIDVRQGYAKCSLCPAGENAAVTDDESIYKALIKNGCDALLISKGDVALSDSHYGFFGGATGFDCKRRTLFVNGELKYHRDADKIKIFLEERGVKITGLTEGKIKDTGSILIFG